MSSAVSPRPKVAVVGATGAVGGQIVELIHERGFLCQELVLFAQEAGSVQEADAGQSQEVSELKQPAALSPFDLAFLAVSESRAAEIIRANPGPVLIDLSGANRADPRAPLVAPGLIGRERMAQLKTSRVFEIAHPAAHVIATVLRALGLGPRAASVTVMLGASARGRARMAEMLEQSADLLNARLNVDEGEPQLAFNIFTDAHSRAAAGVIAAQVAGVTGAPAPPIQAVNVPVLHGSAVSIALGAGGDAREMAARLRAAPGLLLVEDVEFAGVVDALGQEAAIVKLESGPAGTAVWCAFDNARLAALSALWVAETLMASANLD